MDLNMEIKEARREGYDACMAFYFEGAAQRENPYDRQLAESQEHSGDDVKRLVALAEAWGDGFAMAEFDK